MDPRDHKILDCVSRIRRKAKSRGLTGLVSESDAFCKQSESAGYISIPYSLHLMTQGLQLDNDAIAEECLDCISALVVSGLITGTEIMMREVPSSSTAFGRAMNVVIVVSVHEACAKFRSEKVQRKAMDCLVATALSPNCAVTDTLLLRTVQTCFNAMLMTTLPSVVTCAQRALRRTLIDCVVGRLSVPDPPPSSDDLMNLLKVPVVFPKLVSELEACSSILSPFECDFFLIFRSLCMLAVTPISSDSNEHSIDVRTRCAALELINLVLSHGTVLPRCSTLLACCRKYIDMAVLENFAATRPTQLFDFATKISQTIIVRYNQTLRFMVEEYIHAFRVVLLSPWSTFHAKATSIKAITRVILQEGLLIELYMNHDCQVNYDYVVYNLVGTIVEFSLRKWGSNMGFTASQQTLLRRLGMDALRCMVVALQQWVVEPRTSHNTEATTMTLAGLQSLRDHKRKIDLAVSKLNDDWKLGLGLLEECSVIPHNDPLAFAQFLRYNSNVHPEALKEIFSRLKKSQYNKDLVASYIRMLSLSGVLIDVAVKEFVGLFPVESGKPQFEGPVWEALMMILGTEFAHANPSLGMSPDHGDVLAQLVIMLHTTQHNKQITAAERFQEDKFIRQAMECVKGATGIDDKYFRDLFQRVSSKEWDAKAVPQSFQDTEDSCLNPAQPWGDERFIEPEQIASVRYHKSIMFFHNAMSTRRAHQDKFPVPQYLVASLPEHCTDVFVMVSASYIAALEALAARDLANDLVPVCTHHQLALELMMDLASYLNVDLKDVITERADDLLHKIPEVRVTGGSVLGAVWIGVVQLHIPCVHRV